MAIISFFFFFTLACKGVSGRVQNSLRDITILSTYNNFIAVIVRLQDQYKVAFKKH